MYAKIKTHSLKDLWVRVSLRDHRFLEKYAKIKTHSLKDLWVRASHGDHRFLVLKYTKIKTHSLKDLWVRASLGDHRFFSKVCQNKDSLSEGSVGEGFPWKS